MTKRTKVVAPKISIGDRTSQTDEGLHALAESARRLVDAVKPRLNDVLETATSAMDAFDANGSIDERADAITSM